MIVSPSEGVLQPHSDSLVEFTFAPKFKAEKVHFKSQSIKINPKQYISRLQLQMMDSAMPSVVKDDPLDLVFKSRVCMIDARLSTDALSFGKRATGDRVCQSLTLFNENQEMPMTFAIDKTANFKCSPASGRVAPKSFIKIEVSFAPNQIGDLGKEMKVNLYGITESNVKKPLAVQKFRVSGIGFCATKTKTADPARIDGGADDKRLDNHAKLSSTDMDIRGTEHALAGSEDDQIAAAHGIGRFNNFHGDDQLSMDSDIIEFERNRKHYNDYIRRHRKETMKETRRAILLGQRENEDMVDDKKITREIIEEWQKTDIDNG